MTMAISTQLQVANHCQCIVSCIFQMSHKSGEYTVFAEAWITERVNVMSKAMGQRQQQSIVWHFRVHQRPSHPEIQAVTNHQEWNVVERM